LRNELKPGWGGIYSVRLFESEKGIGHLEPKVVSRVFCRLDWLDIEGSKKGADGCRECE
jgi:hypothetical protein